MATPKQNMQPGTYRRQLQNKKATRNIKRPTPKQNNQLGTYRRQLQKTNNIQLGT